MWLRLYYTSSPEAHSDGEARRIGTGELHEAWKKCFLLNWLSSTIRSYFEDFVCYKVKDRLMPIGVKISTQWETYNFKLALIAVGVSIRAANRVKNCRTHIRASWQWFVSRENCGNYIKLDDMGNRKRQKKGPMLWQKQNMLGFVADRDRRRDISLRSRVTM